MWYEIKSQKDIEKLMDVFGRFHDSCVKSMEYVSGAYVKSNFLMHATNDVRSLRIVIQRQYDYPRTIVLEFNGLCHLVLKPQNIDETCEIFEATMHMLNNRVTLNIDGDEKSRDGTLHICAEKARWREDTEDKGTVLLS